MTEQWRPVVGYEGFYEVSDLGRVRSLPRPSRPGKRSYEGKVLSDGSRKGKYHAVHLCKLGKIYVAYVHHVVLCAFVGPRPEGMDGCHNNGDLHDNRLVNLRWDSRRANIRDKLGHGTENIGTRNGSAKLADEDVRRIREMVLFGARRRDIAVTFGIHHLHVSNIMRRDTWKHV